ncbi:unnamed protein product, partial [marine sediment metagenome]
ALQKLQLKQKQDLQGLVKPLHAAFHVGNAKVRLDVAVKKIKADKLQKEIEKLKKLKKPKKEKK